MKLCALAIFDFESNSLIVSDGNIALYCQPKRGNHVLTGSEDPICNKYKWVASDIVYCDNFSDHVDYSGTVLFPVCAGIGHQLKAVGLFDILTDWFPLYDKFALEVFYGLQTDSFRAKHSHSYVPGVKDPHFKDVLTVSLFWMLQLCLT